MMFFFFKQKTAYEMRISDWSSDVCSSDLPAEPGEHLIHAFARHSGIDADEIARFRPPFQPRRLAGQRFRIGLRLPDLLRNHIGIVGQVDARSEEHTSELQSLMRISYAVFCLQKKTILIDKYERFHRKHHHK